MCYSSLADGLTALAAFSSITRLRLAPRLTLDDIRAVIAGCAVRVAARGGAAPDRARYCDRRWATVVVGRGGARRAVVALGVLGVTRPARTPRRTDRPRIDAVAALGAFGSRACVLRAPVGAAGDLAAGLEVT